MVVYRALSWVGEGESWYIGHYFWWVRVGGGI